MAEPGEIEQQADMLLKRTAQRRQVAKLVPDTQIATKRAHVQGEKTIPLIISTVDKKGEPIDVPGRYIGVYTKDDDGNLTPNAEPLTYFDEKKKALIGEDGKPIRELQKRKSGNRLVTEPDVDNKGQFVEFEKIMRSPTNRLIRGSLAAALKDIKHLPGIRRSLFSGFIAEARKMSKNLDKLDYQFHKSGRFFETGDGTSERDTIYGVELDLNKPPEGVEDTRIPWVMIGGASSTSEQNATLSMALALQGERVFVLTFPDQMKEQTGGRSFREKIANTYDEDFNAFRRVIEDLGFSKVNVIGHSLGGGLALELAGDQELSQKVQIEDVLALDPTGFERRWILPMSWAFKNTAQDIEKDPEAQISMLEQGKIDAYRAIKIGQEKGILKSIKAGWNFLSSGRASASKRFSPERLAEISRNVSGNVEIWTGESNRVVKPEAIIECVKNAGDVPNLSLHVIEGGRHEAIIANALGFIRIYMDEKRLRDELGDLYRKQIKTTSIDTLERSGAEHLLKDIQAKSK